MGGARFSAVRLFSEYVRRQIYMHGMANKSLKISALLFLVAIFPSFRPALSLSFSFEMSRHV